MAKPIHRPGCAYNASQKNLYHTIALAQTLPFITNSPSYTSPSRPQTNQSKHTHIPLIRRILPRRAALAAPILALKHPMTIPRRDVDLVPPAEPHEPAAGDVLEVVEVGGEDEHGEDEDEDEGAGEEPEAEEVDEEGG